MLGLILVITFYFFVEITVSLLIKMNNNNADELFFSFFKSNLWDADGFCLPPHCAGLLKVLVALENMTP